MLPNKIKSLCSKTKKIALILDRMYPKNLKIFKNKLNKYELVILNFHVVKNLNQWKLLIYLEIITKF